MHWADKIVKEIITSNRFKPYWVDDMKTPSGFAHIGSMLGPIIHSCIYRALNDAGHDATFTYVFNDFDVADEFPPEIKEKYKEHAGKVLKMIPSPDSRFENLADYLADDLKKSMEYLGFEARYISSWELYHQGKFDEVIKLALDKSEKIQDIYEKVAGSKKKESGWLPFQVICEKCGKLGTTKVFAWDGEKVSYRCEPDLVTWAEGCGHTGAISPFGGNGKLPWKVDWAAHWKVLGMTIEAAGKDHASAGGSYDIALRIIKDIFKGQDLYHFGYEFILIGGKKMSSSKGLGLKAHDLVNILPPEVARFLFVSKDIKSQTNFDPVGTMAIPDLFDEYDKAWEAFDRSFVLSQISKVPTKEKKFFALRFRDIANYLSQGFSEKEIAEKVGESAVIGERIKYARIWLENYAPDEYRFEMTEKIPKGVESLSPSQKGYLKGVLKVYNEGDDAESLQISLYELAKQLGIPAKDAFAAIYMAFIGKFHGPRAGMLLTKFGREKVIERIEVIANE